MAFAIWESPVLAIMTKLQLRFTSISMTSSDTYPRSRTRRTLEKPLALSSSMVTRMERVSGMFPGILR